MSRVEILPLSAEHLDAAAALLAARHHENRTREPDLPARFEAPGAARAILERRLRRPGSTGVVAVSRGRVVGYLIGVTLVTPPTSRSFLAPRAGFIGYADHVIGAEDATAVYGAMYGALATGWIDAGCLSHHVQVPATEPHTEERWHTLGFGREFVTAVRHTEGLGPTEWPGDIRRARGEDLDTILEFIDAFHRFEVAAPMSRPYLPETPEERIIQSQMLDDPACACWIASQDGKPLAMQRFQPPPPYLSPMIVPDRSVYLLTSYSEPAARGSGIGTSLLAAGMAWARDAGHLHCLLHFTAANSVSARFWRGRGFRPIEYWLCRRLDGRLISARLHKRDA